MKTTKKMAFLLAGLSVLGLTFFGVSSLVKSRSTKTLGAAESTTPSKVDLQILRAQQTIEKMPDKSDGYNQLAAAYMQKARETGNFSLNANADTEITRSLALETDNYDALKLRAKLQLTYHRFAEALETARQAQRVRTDDHDVWGQITDALVELGDYPGAVKSAQKMIDLRPDSSSYARVSYLRSLHGDTDGAIQAMVAAVKAANPNDREGIAWCRVQLGNELLNAGKLDAAEHQYDEALRTFADHSLAQEGKARARIAAGDLQGAVEIYERRQAKSASADAAQSLGDLFTLLGQLEGARKQYETFEVLERENAILERSWRHMVNYWLDHDKNLDQALTLATREYEARKDIFTCDLLAWALFKNGRVEESKKLINEALRTGSKDARINFHAGIIYKSLNMRERATKSNTRLFNHHVLIPDVAKIKAGGTVNFIIAGFHQVIVYDDGTQPTDINTNLTIPLTNPLPPPSPLLINDSNRRIYRGPDPSTQPADRVEVVHFAEPGTYLVICGVLPHFQSAMFGYVKVLP